MIYFARFLVKRNCQHFPHHCSPFNKHYFVKMFLLTNMNNSRASLHLRLKIKTKQRGSVAPLLGERKSQTGRMTERPAELGRPGNRTAMLHKLQPSWGFLFSKCLIHQHVFSLTFVKPLLLLRVNLSACTMACGLYPPSLTEMGKLCYSLSQRILSRILTPIWLLLLGKKKKSTFWKLNMWWLFYHNCASQE